MMFPPRSIAPQAMRSPRAQDDDLATRVASLEEEITNLKARVEKLEPNTAPGDPEPKPAAAAGWKAAIEKVTRG